MIVFLDSLIEGMGYVYFLTNYLTKHTRFRTTYPFLFLFWSFLLSSLNFFEITIGYKMEIFLIIVGFIYCFYLFSNSLVEILFTLLFSMSMIIFTNTLAIFLTKFILWVTFHDLSYFNQMYPIVALFSKLFYFITIFYIIKRKRDSSTVTSASMIYLLIIYALLTTATSIELKNYACTSFLEPIKDPILFILSSLILFIYFLYMKLCEETTRNMELILLQRETENMKEYMDTLTKINNENKMLRHDLKNMLLLAKKEGNAKQDIYEEIEKYMYTAPSIVTKNTTLNDIVNTKIFSAKDPYIHWEFYIETDLIHINRIDLAVLLGNLIDNAIENVGGNKVIRLHTKLTNNMYHITIRNTIAHTVLTNNKNLKTKKADTSIHGYGIKSIKRLVSSYNGTIDFSEEDDYFVVQLLLEKRNNP